MPTGTGVLSFGAFPGAQAITLAVTGQTGILSGSLVEAELRPITTADHSVDEQVAESLFIVASDIVPGTGFTIRAHCRNGLLYGDYNVQWVWV